MSTDPKQMEPASLRDVIVDALDEEVHYASPVIDRLIDEVEAHVRWTMNGVDALQQVAIADWERECERLKAKVARVEALAAGLQEQYEASDYSETTSLGEIAEAIRAALAEPERDEESEEIHHCDGCGEDYNILAESHVGHQPERDEEGGR